MGLNSIGSLKVKCSRQAFFCVLSALYIPEGERRTYIFAAKLTVVDIWNMN